MKILENDWSINFAAHVVRHGGVVAYPTESVWGLGCDPDNVEALAQLFALKQRPIDKGLILVSGQIEHFEFLLKTLPLTLQQRFAQVQCRPTTWLVPDPFNKVSSLIKGRHASVALRVSHHPELQCLTKRLGYPIVSTSANPAGREPADSRLKLVQYFNSGLDYVMRASLNVQGQPSTIRDLVSNTVVRY